MEIILYYEGKLKSNGNSASKNELRAYFQNQLRNLWQGPALSDRDDLRKYPVEGGNVSSIVKVGDMYFLPLVSSNIKLICELDILMLRPEPIGNLISGGDIDNRIKTLLDGLRMPSNIDELPRERLNTDLGNPFYILLQDDKLISKLSVEVGELLLTDQMERNYVKLIIKVNIKPTKSIFANLGF